MTWNELKIYFPVGDIRNWTVKIIRGYIIMDYKNMDIDAILEVTSMSDNMRFPLLYPLIGDNIECVVIGHSPVDKKIRLSAKHSDIIKFK